MSDFIPSGDADFNLWQDNLLNFLSAPANRTRLQLSEADLSVVSAPQGAWERDYPAHLEAQRAALVASNAKNSARAALEEALRPFIAVLQKNANLSDADRTALRITVPAVTRQAAPVPTSAPVGSVDFSRRLTHSISFRDENTPQTKAKPDGVRGAQIYIQIGGSVPSGPDGFSFLATDTRAPYVHAFEMNDIGKTVHYLLRWENTTGKVGPWSEIVSAVVAG